MDVDRATLERVIASPENHLRDPAPLMRRLAVSALEPDASRRHEHVLRSLLRSDPVPAVRAAAAEALGGAGLGEDAIVEALLDGEPVVVESAITALGELGNPAVVGAVIQVATDEAADKLAREAAVAALGAIASPDGLPTLLQLVANGPPQVRRRCVVALTVFDGPEVEAAIESALRDRNPMVREAAEMVMGRPIDPPPTPLELGPTRGG